LVFALMGRLLTRDWFRPIVRATHSPKSTPRTSLSGAELIRSLNPAHPQRKPAIPALAPQPLRLAVLRVPLPLGDRLLAPPVRHRDAETVLAAHALHAQEARH